MSIHRFAATFIVLLAAGCSQPMNYQVIVPDVTFSDVVESAVIDTGRDVAPDVRADVPMDELDAAMDVPVDAPIEAAADVPTTDGYTNGSCPAGDAGACPTAMNATVTCESARWHRALSRRLRGLHLRRWMRDSDRYQHDELRCLRTRMHGRRVASGSGCLHGRHMYVRVSGRLRGLRWCRVDRLRDPSTGRSHELWNLWHGVLHGSERDRNLFERHVWHRLHGRLRRLQCAQRRRLRNPHCRRWLELRGVWSRVHDGSECDDGLHERILYCDVYRWPRGV